MQNSTQNKETPANQTICEKTNETNVQRTYKSRLFEMIFSEKAELLELLRLSDAFTVKEEAIRKLIEEPEH